MKDYLHTRVAIESHRIVVLVLAAFVLMCPRVNMLVVRGQAKHPNQTNWKFDFGPGKVARGYKLILANTVYGKELGYGFEPGAKVTGLDRGGKDALRSDFCASNQPFYFSVALPEGNYDVTVTLGDAQEETITTVKAELRRLMLERVQTARGKFVTRTFTVNVRTPQITADGVVKLKDREKTTEWWSRG